MLPRTVVRTTLVLAVLLSYAASAAASARSRPVRVGLGTPVTSGARYLALGDSVTFGFQEMQVVPAPNYRDPASFPGYPEQLGAALHLRVTNLACPGETSGSLINVSVRSNGCENAYRRAFPLHVGYSGSQLDFAVSFLRRHPETRLVSLMVGANDLFICQGTTKDGCSSPSEQNAVLGTISRNVRTVLSAVRNRAHYRGQLAIVNYYSLNYTSAFITNASLGLNLAMDSAARPFHVRIAGGFEQFKAAAAHSGGGDSCAAGLLTQLGAPGKCGVHPSFAGQALLSKALLSAIHL